ncbi:MAG: right-handed parallel beta-helix repeat-containing protein [Akkermansiaceae bacterium]|jgi:parallel beta-helix repeat protein|nr:right-handed parallel beta-helix repeat-containing protein [Akkermansiaceae bacterium]
MTIEEAKKILGLSEDQDPTKVLGDLAHARDQLAGMAADAPTEALKERFEGELREFEEAMGLLQEESERIRRAKLAQVMALVPGAVSGGGVKSKREGFLDEPMPPRKGAAPATESAAPVVEAPLPPPAKTELLPQPAAVEEGKAKKKSRQDALAMATAGEKKGKGLGFYLILCLLLGGIGGAGIYLYVQQQREYHRQTELSFLEGLGNKLVEARRWDEAFNAFLRIEELEPGSEVAQLGRQAIQEGRREEQDQFVGYWTGEAQSAFEAGRLEDAEAAAAQVLEKYPEEKAVLELKARIGEARAGFLRDRWGKQAREGIEARDWPLVQAAIVELRTALPGDPLLASLERELAAGREKELKDLQRARELAAAARLRDTGSFDPQALEWVQEAVSLAPKDEEILKLYEKIASYSRTLRVPQDVATLAEALKGARDRDRIVLGEGRFKAGIAVNAAVQIEGQPDGKTVLFVDAVEAPVLTLGPRAKGVRLTNLVFEAQGFDAGELRYPAVQVRGGDIEAISCEFRDASGCGLEVIDGGHAKASRCLFDRNGWDGMCARGKGSRITATESRSISNFGHGFQIWDGAVAEITRCVVKGNARNGILIDSAADGLVVSENEVADNREYGILLSAGASGKVSENLCEGNHLGGLLVRFAAMSVVVEGNRIIDNHSDGLILEQGLRPDIYESNQLRSNEGRNLRQNARFGIEP